MAKQHGLLERPPKVVAELGPGDSLGIGLAALLSGVERYYGLDLVRFASDSRNLAIFEELVALFRARDDIPGETEFPDVGLNMDSYRFPSELITGEILQGSLDETRLQEIRAALQGGKTNNPHIAYIVPWNDPGALPASSVDMVFAQAVLEHVDDLAATYQAVYRWLKPGGLFSQEIDFTDHGIAGVWNGHWSYSDWTWRLMRGNRSFFINREPLTTHLNLLVDHGFKIAFESRKKDSRGIKRQALAREFREISDEDLATYSCFIQAIKLPL
jgi:SAM-dependent methyltransferase